MGMYIYQSTAFSNGKIELTDPEKIKLSGEDGLIARYFKLHEDEELQSWILETDEIASISGTEVHDPVVVMVSKLDDEEKPTVSVIKSITGKCMITQTDMVIVQYPLAHIQTPIGPQFPPLSIVCSEWKESQLVFDSIVISGANTNLSHSWKLMPPKMHIGGVIR